jgi:uncharacterized protein with HEPN domain
MKQKREYIDYLRDILDAAQKAEEFIAGMDMAALPRSPVACYGWDAR